MLVCCLVASWEKLTAELLAELSVELLVVTKVLPWDCWMADQLAVLRGLK